MLSRGRNVYGGGSPQAHFGGGPQFGRPPEGPSRQWQPMQQPGMMGGAGMGGMDGNPLTRDGGFPGMGGGGNPFAEAIARRMQEQQMEGALQGGGGPEGQFRDMMMRSRQAAALNIMQNLMAQKRAAGGPGQMRQFQGY